MLIAASAAIAIHPATAQSPRSITPPPPPPPATTVQPARATPDMQVVLDALASPGGKPIGTLTPAEARVQPSAADGAGAVGGARQANDLALANEGGIRGRRAALIALAA